MNLRCGGDRRQWRLLYDGGNQMSESEYGSGKRIDPGKAVTWPVGVGLGAALGYFLDPENGRRRRRLVHDKAVHFKRVGATGARKAIADAENRLRGAVAEVRARAEDERHVPDDVLVSRVRARLGHVASHPRAIEVYARDGSITLSGPTLESEADAIIREIGAVPGVHQVHDQLERFESAEDVPSLQGGRERRGHRLLGSEWTPAYRMFGMAASLPLLGYGLRQRGASGGVVAGLGASLLARSLTNLPLSKLTGVGAGPDLIRLRKHLHVDATPEDVFTHLRNPGNVQDLFTLLDSVAPVARPTSEGGAGAVWELVASGPAGLPIRWQVELTEVIPNERVSWRSVEGGRVEMEGNLRIHSADGSGSYLDLDLCYNPPGGILGDLLATLLGSGVRHYLKEDLPRIQRIFEHGKETAASRLEGQTEAGSADPTSFRSAPERSTAEGGLRESGDRSQPAH